jgi:flagellar motor switch protein FliN/FliY
VASQTDIDELLAEAEALVSETDAELTESAPPQAGPQPSTGEAPLATPVSHLPPDLRRTLKIQVPLIVRLAHKKMPTAQVVNLAPGSIIEFDKGADEPLDLMTNNTCIGYGSPVKVGENFGIRVTSILNAKGKLEALTRK